MKTEQDILRMVDQLVSNLSRDLGADLRLPIVLEVLQDIFSRKLYEQVEAYVSSMSLSELLCMMGALEKRIDKGMQQKTTVKVSKQSQHKH